MVDMSPLIKFAVIYNVIIPLSVWPFYIITYYFTKLTRNERLDLSTFIYSLTVFRLFQFPRFLIYLFSKLSNEDIHRVSKKTSTHIIGYKLRNSCPIVIIFDIKIPHII